MLTPGAHTGCGGQRWGQDGWVGGTAVGRSLGDRVKVAGSQFGAQAEGAAPALAGFGLLALGGQQVAEVEQRFGEHGLFLEGVAVDADGVLGAALFLQPAGHLEGEPGSGLARLGEAFADADDDLDLSRSSGGKAKALEGAGVVWLVGQDVFKKLHGLRAAAPPWW